MFKVEKHHRKRGRGRQLFWGVLLIGGALVLWSVFPGCVRGPRHAAHGTPEQAVARLDRGAEWALREVEATDAQRTKITAIIEALKPEVRAFHQARHSLRAEFVGALEADPVNPAEFERIREAGLDLTDGTFARGIDAAVKISEVLTAEQRRQLAQAWKQHQ